MYVKKSTKKHLITSALPYANGPLHIGHIAGAYLPADIYARYLRMNGEDVAFMCGSDEHGAAITLRAKKEGVSPKEIVDKYNAIISKSFDEFGISFDIFHRTSASEHHATAQDFFKVLEDKSAFEKQTSEQFYDEKNNQFLADRYISGECPKCANPNAYGDQCEKCGSTLSPDELINPKSTISGETPVMKETSHWYLPMNKHEEWLKEYIEKGTLDGTPHHDVKAWKNHVIGQCKSWIDGGLMPRAMTRDLDWGVKVPVEGADGKVLYVWLDAPIGYITATKVWAEERGKNWEDYWKGEDSEIVHFIGKDNIVFHCIIFPILLREHGSYNLPVNVPANEFMNLEGDKISTSRNWAVWLHEYLEDFPGKQDELKYVLTSIMPEAKDSEFTWTDYKDRINNELADVLGNYLNRVIVLTLKYYGGVVPEVALQREDKSTLNEALESAGKVSESIEKFRFREALSAAMNLARIGNRHLTALEPWKLQKTDPERVKSIMLTHLQIAANLTVALAPFLPNKAAQIAEALGVDNSEWIFSEEKLTKGSTIQKMDILFEKVEEETIQKQVDKLEASKKQTMEASKEVAERPEQKAEIAFEDFMKVDMRVGTILEAEKVKKADRLLKLLVDTGIDKRTVVSGIAQSFTPEEIIGKKVTVLLNLAPRKIKGIESQGMILMAENADGKLSFLEPDDKHSTDSGDGVS
ncbi:MAG: methionine--tRNA ligase [Flavobacteriales bacterium]